MQNDERFDEVIAALMELRKYMESAFATLKEELTLTFTSEISALKTEMNAGFTRLDRKLDRLLDSPPMRRRRRRS